jgi:hypothetical protein
MDGEDSEIAVNSQALADRASTTRSVIPFKPPLQSLNPHPLRPV